MLMFVYMHGRKGGTKLSNSVSLPKENARSQYWVLDHKSKCSNAMNGLQYGCE